MDKAFAKKYLLLFQKWSITFSHSCIAFKYNNNTKQSSILLAICIVTNNMRGTGKSNNRYQVIGCVDTVEMCVGNFTISVASDTAFFEYEYQVLLYLLRSKIATNKP